MRLRSPLGAASAQSGSPVGCLSDERQLSPAPDITLRNASAAMCQMQIHAPQQTVQLFDHLVGAAEKRNGEGEAQRVGGLKIDHELDLLVLLDRQIGGLGTFENPTGVGTDEAICLDRAGPIAHQAASSCALAPCVDRRQPVLSC